MGTLRIKQCNKTGCFKTYKKKYGFALGTPLEGGGTMTTHTFHYCSKSHLKEGRQKVLARIRKIRVENLKLKREKING